MKLTASQTEAVEYFQNFLQNPNQQEMVLCGAAGTGKTFLTKYLIDLAEKQFELAATLTNQKETNIFITATTNKAAQVLKDVLDKPTSTIHSRLGLKVKTDFKTGKVNLQPTVDINPDSVNILYFIDEASMLNKELYYYIKKFILENPNNKVVYIGDQYQLPPVKEVGHLLFETLPNRIELTEIQRQLKDSKIITASQQYKDVVQFGKDKLWPQLDFDNKEVVQVTGSELQDLIDNKFSKTTDPNDLKIIAYTNKRVKEYNQHVRQVLGMPERLQVGEWVVINNAVSRNNTIIYPTDKVVQVVRISRISENHGYKGYWYSFCNSPYAVFVPENPFQVAQDQKRFAKAGKWQEYFILKEEFADLRPLHAITCHKAQGSTYNEVFIDLHDIGTCNKWEEVARLTYVAITRAKQAVYIYGSLNPHKYKK